MQLVVIVARRDVEPVIPVGSNVFHGTATRSMMMTSIGFLSHRLGSAFHLELYHFWLWHLLAHTFILSLVVILLNLISMILLWGCLFYSWCAGKV